VDDGAVLPLLERLVGPRAVVVRHSPRAVPLIGVALLRAVPACHPTEPIVRHPLKLSHTASPGPRPGRGRGGTCAVLALGRGAVGGGGGVVAGPLVHPAAAGGRSLDSIRFGLYGEGNKSRSGRVRVSGRVWFSSRAGLARGKILHPTVQVSAGCAAVHPTKHTMLHAASRIDTGATNQSISQHPLHSGYQ
jgi:hypothetical protein